LAQAPVLEVTLYSVPIMADSAEAEGTRWGDDVWKDDDKVRTVSGQHYEPWLTWDACCGPWKFPNGLMQFLMDAGFTCPTPIQAHTWPVLMDGKDVVGVAKTGSGKTLGYLLPGYIKVKREEMQNSFSCDHAKGPAMLIIAPTRELCQQIFEESERFGKPAQITTACVYGGASRQPQIRSLWNSPHCVVATPGRLNDFLGDGSIKVGQVLYLVLDEADRMLDMGFEPQIKELKRFLPEKTQNAFFTATWPREVQAIARNLTANPSHVQVGSSDASTTNSDITQAVIKVYSEGDKMKHLEEVIFPGLQARSSSALIFTKTKRAAASMYQTLQRAGAPIGCLHGDMEQRERDRALWNFKNGKSKVLVATDVAQRGLDIKNVEFVINYDPPSTMEDYVHRIGRTGRAGSKGDAITYLYENETGPAQFILKVMKKSGQPIPEDLRDLCGGGGSNMSGGWGGYKSGNRGKGKGGW